MSTRCRRLLRYSGCSPRCRSRIGYAPQCSCGERRASARILWPSRLYTALWYVLLHSQDPCDFRKKEVSHDASTDVTDWRVLPGGINSVRLAGARPGGRDIHRNRRSQDGGRRDFQRTRHDRRDPQDAAKRGGPSDGGVQDRRGGRAAQSAGGSQTNRHGAG